MADRIAVFDGHNDFLLRLLGDPARREEIWLEGEGRGHIDLPRMKAGHLVGGFFAVYVPSPRDGSLASMDEAMENPPYAGCVETRMRLRLFGASICFRRLRPRG